MTKYIVKNCPAYGVTTPTSCALTSDDSCEFTDCPIKQVIKLLTETCSISDLLNTEELRLTDRGILAKQILQTLQVEEVE